MNNRLHSTPVNPVQTRFSDPPARRTRPHRPSEARLRAIARDIAKFDPILADILERVGQS